MRIALAQTSCPWGAIEENLRRDGRLIREARKGGADLIAFPETSVPGMYKDHLVRLCAQALDGPIVERMCRWARRYGIAVGFGLAEKTAGKPYNAYVLIDRSGSLAGVHRKNYVPVLERPYFRRDTRRPVFGLEGVRVAVSICADHGFPELHRSYSRRGARLVLFPHAWDADPVLTNGRTAGWRSEEDMVEHFAQGRVARYRTHAEMLSFFRPRIASLAAEGAFYAAFVNQVGTPYPLTPFVGPSFVVDPGGRTVARSRSKREGLLYADLDL